VWGTWQRYSDGTYVKVVREKHKDVKVVREKHKE